MDAYYTFQLFGIVLAAFVKTYFSLLLFNFLRRRQISALVVKMIGVVVLPADIQLKLLS